MKEKIETPTIAIICSVLAWLALILGVFLIIGGISDSANPHVTGSTGEITSGAALFFSSIIWFIAAKVITLLAQIARNTRREPP